MIVIFSSRFPRSSQCTCAPSRTHFRHHPCSFYYAIVLVGLGLCHTTRRLEFVWLTISDSLPRAAANDAAAIADEIAVAQRRGSEPRLPVFEK